MAGCHRVHLAGSLLVLEVQLEVQEAPEILEALEVLDDLDVQEVLEVLDDPDVLDDLEVLDSSERRTKEGHPPAGQRGQMAGSRALPPPGPRLGKSALPDRTPTAHAAFRGWISA